MILVIGAARVPDLPPAPELSGSGGPVSYALAAITVMFIVLFVGMVVRAELGVLASRRPLRLVAILATGLVVSAGGSYVAFRVHVDAERREFSKHLRETVDARGRALAALEREYGISFDASLPIVPLDESHAPREEPVTLPDGTSVTCWIDIEGDHYVVLCGGDSPQTSAQLDPVAR